MRVISKENGLQSQALCRGVGVNGESDMRGCEVNGESEQCK